MVIDDMNTAGTMQEEYDRLHQADPDEDMVNNPSHYQSYLKDGIDCITAMQHAFGIEATAIFCKLNAFKYNWRATSKGGNEDISKAIWYLNKYLELNK